MLMEALVFTTCLQNKGGCSESTAAYIKSNPQIEETIKNVEKIGQRLVNGNEWIVYAATPFLAVVSGKPANFTMARGVVLGVNVKEELVILQWSY